MNWMNPIDARKICIDLMICGFKHQFVLWKYLACISLIFRNTKCNHLLIHIWLHPIWDLVFGYRYQYKCNYIFNILYIYNVWCMVYGVVRFEFHSNSKPIEICIYFTFKWNYHFKENIPNNNNWIFWQYYGRRLDSFYLNTKYHISFCGDVSWVLYKSKYAANE